MIVISVIRKGAFKRLTLSTSDDNYLSILQIFETTDDVVNYTVAELDKYYRPVDRYIPSMHGFGKWNPIPKLEV